MGPSLVWRRSCICDTINNRHYNGVPVSAKDPAQVCITRTPGTSLLKNLPAMQEPLVQSLSRDEAPEKRNGDPLQYSCLENSMDKGTWHTTVYGVAKSQTWLSDKC